MARASVTVRRRRVTKYTVKTKRKGKGRKRCPKCGRYM